MNNSFGVLAILMWGCLALLGSLTTKVPAFQLLFLCFIISALLMIIKRLFTRTHLFALPSMTWQQWFVGTIGLFGFHFCYFVALKKAPAIDVTLICYLWPMLLAILMSSKQNWHQALIGGVVGFVGICFIILGNASITVTSEYSTGYLLAFCCALIWSGYSWFFAHADNPVDDIGWLSLIVAVLSLIAHLQLEQSNWQLTSYEWLGIILLGIGPVGGAFYLWDSGLKKGNAKLLASLSFSTPLISAILLAIFGLNTWSINILIALSLIITGALITNYKKVAIRG